MSTDRVMQNKYLNNWKVMSPEQIKTMRQDMKLSQEDFAHKLGVTYGTVNRWENGGYKPSKMAIQRIKEVKDEYERN